MVAYGWWNSRGAFGSHCEDLICPSEPEYDFPDVRKSPVSLSCSLVLCFLYDITFADHKEELVSPGEKNGHTFGISQEPEVAYSLCG